MRERTFTKNSQLYNNTVYLHVSVQVGMKFRDNL